MNRKYHAVLTAIATVLGNAVPSDGSAGDAARLYHTPAAKRDVADFALNGISVGGLVEVEAGIGEDVGADISDIVLATFELGLDATLREDIRARTLLLWEEDDTEPVDLDEAVITLGGTETMPWFIEGGRMYVPFGAFHSHFVSDPLVLELGETRETAVLIGYATRRLKIEAGAFNGNRNAEDDDDQVDDAVAALTLIPRPGLELGAYWMADIGESDVLEETFQNADTDNVGGAGAFVHAEIGRLTLEAEYITATEQFRSALPATSKPRAWNVEAAVSMGADWTLAAKAEGSDAFPDMPETQVGVAGSHTITETVAVALEYLHGSYATDLDNRNLVTAQVAVEF